MPDHEIQLLRDALAERTLTPLRQLRAAGIRKIHVVCDDQERVVELLQNPNFHAVDQDGSDVLIVETAMEGAGV